MSRIQDLHRFVNDQVFGFIVICPGMRGCCAKLFEELNFLTDFGKYSTEGGNVVTGDIRSE